MNHEYTHVPVLYQEVLQLLQPVANGRYVDGTVGGGGHTVGILQASAPNGCVLAFDKDIEAITFARQQLAQWAGRVVFVHASYADMAQWAAKHEFAQVEGVLLDLGLSSRQLDNPERGFSFLKEGPLDMRFDTTQGETAADLINNLSESGLADIFWRYGEEPHSRKFAREIVAKRPFFTTTQLANCIAGLVKQRGRIHPATQLFQALRIAVNQELQTVERGLQAALDLLKPGGRLAVISFHSLEDRLVKQTFRHISRSCVCPPQQPICTCAAHASFRLVTRKAVKASEAEIATNPRSRSARLRVVERLNNPAV